MSPDNLLTSQHETLTDMAADFAKLRHHLAGYNLGEVDTKAADEIIDRTLTRIGGLMLDLEDMAGAS
jgi:hypothetical protein